MEKLEIILLTEVWNDLLGTMNKTSLSLQNSTTTMNDATKLYTSLVDYVNNIGNNFDQYESAATEKNQMLNTQISPNELEFTAHASLF